MDEYLVVVPMDEYLVAAKSVLVDRVSNFARKMKQRGDLLVSDVAESNISTVRSRIKMY
jgi:hypothetical protein